jgi:serine/threonine-protein kinase RsbW/stage II sporulation protein AB (anti-sigma F factor)
VPPRAHPEQAERRLAEPPPGGRWRGYSRQIANNTDAHAGDRLSRAWKAVPASVAEARGAVAEFARAAGMDAATLAALRVAVSEAVTNAVLHAYLDAPEAGPVHVTAERAGDEMWVAISDEGRGMIPRPDSPGIGLGLPLIARMTQGFELHERDGGGTVLRMRFGI